MSYTVRHTYLAATILINLITIVACQTASPRPPLATEPARSIIETKVPFTASAISFSTKTQAISEPTTSENSVLSVWNDLAKGQYLLVQTYESGIPSLKIISNDGQLTKSIPEDGFFWNTSNDGSSVLMIQPNLIDAQYFDLSTKYQYSLRLNNKCYDASWSSNSDHLVMACENGSTIDLYVLEHTTGDIIKLTDCLEKDLECGAPSWSPDGQWIAYSRNEIKSGPPSTENGVYLLNASCIKDNRCISRQIGPVRSESNPTWTQANLLAVSVNEGIQLYSIQANSITLVTRIDTHITNVRDIYASPDGEYLAYAPIGNKIVYLVSLSNSLPQTLYEGENISIVGWVTVP